MPEAQLHELATLMGRSSNLTSVSLVRCELPPQAGMNLAEAVRMATEREFRLEHLDLQNNKLDSLVGHAFALSLRGNCRLTQLNVAQNPMDKDALSELKAAKEEVHEAWRHTEEGREQGKRDSSKHKKEGGSNFVSDVLNMFS